jgi:hypothetical protein
VDPRATECRQKNRSLENFQALYQESTPEPPVLWRSGSWCGHSVGDYLCWCNDNWVYPEKQFSVHKYRTHIAKLVTLHVTLVPPILLTIYPVIKM